MPSNSDFDGRRIPLYGGHAVFSMTIYNCLPCKRELKILGLKGDYKRVINCAFMF